jgi:hypothetical protein
LAPQATDDSNAGYGDQAGDHRVLKRGDGMDIRAKLSQCPADLLHNGNSLSCVEFGRGPLRRFVVQVQ